MATNGALTLPKGAGNRLFGVSPNRTSNYTGEVEIAGHRYVTAGQLARMLGVTVRTLTRWNAARRGPPRIKVGRLVLFDIDKLPAFLGSHETEPVRGQHH